MNNILKEQGFVILKNVFEESSLAEVRSLVDDIIRDGEMNLEDPFEDFFMRHRTDQGALYDLYFRHPEVRSLMQDKKILDELESVLGKDILLYENSLVYKPKGKNNEVPWHQDFMNRTDETEKYIVWCALDNVTIENGALKAIPGSHKLGFMPWYRVKGETHHTRLKLDGVDLSKAEYLEMKAGDVLIFHHLVIHGSDLITSESPRRALRYACQSFDQIHAPRAVPIVLRGGNPSGIRTRYNNPYKSKSKLKNVIHKIGKKLVEF